MANLDKLLRKIEKNKENSEKTTIHQFTIDGETFDVKTLTRRQKRELMYAQEVGKESFTVGEIIQKYKKAIYNSLIELKELAVKAKDAGTINCYYDVIEDLFEPEQIVEIINFIDEINKLPKDEIVEDLEQIKKP